MFSNYDITEIYKGLTPFYSRTESPLLYLATDLEVKLLLEGNISFRKFFTDSSNSVEFL